MEKGVSDFTSVPRFYMALFISFAVLAVVLAATGILRSNQLFGDNADSRDWYSGSSRR